MSLLSEATVSYCEKASNLIIKRPFYAFSNLAYLLSGLLILRERTRLAYAFGFTVILMGMFSFIYDAYPILLTQLFDLFMMFSFASLILWLNALKIKEINAFLFLMLPVLGVLGTYFWGGSAGRIVFGLILLGVITSELYLVVNKKRKSFNIWLGALFIFLLGFGIWMLDATETVCLEGFWALFNGRAIFHYTSAISTYFLYRYYSEQGYKL